MFIKKKSCCDIKLSSSFKPDIEVGLNDEEVNYYKNLKLINKRKKFKGKSHFRIIFESFFTFFNLILYILVIIFALFQNLYPNGEKAITITKYGFLIVIFFNALSNIISSEASKHVIKKMKIISSSKVKVIRNGIVQEINNDDIVYNDIVILSEGDNVPCDIEIVKNNCRVNESMLTGESEPLDKKVGDKVLSGSFIVDNLIYSRVIAVGNETFVAGLENKINTIKKKKSLLISNINKIIKYLVLFLIPIVFLVGFKIYYVGKDGNHFVFTLDIVTKCGATLVGMIPIGMILLSSISLSESIIHLYRQNTMIQNMYAVENLSRVNTLCLDKTGTLTTQNYEVKEYINLTSIDISEIMKIILKYNESNNKTYKALKSYFGISDKNIDIKSIVFFKSEYKYSITNTIDESYYLGAPDIIFKDNKDLLNKIHTYTKQGYRVIGLKNNSNPLGFIVLKDELRKGIVDTLNYFNSLNINIKIISGDNIETVKEVSSLAGVKEFNKAISLENVEISEIKDIFDKYTIFARATPDQKNEIIKCLQSKGEIVGYIGDGVNDTLSLKQANCSVTFNSSVDSCKSLSDVILLDDDFSHLPNTFLEGRRAIANIERSILLFLTKSMFIGLFSLLSVFTKKGLYIEIESIYIYEFVSIALCGFLLSLQNNKNKPIEGNFVLKVIKQSIFYALFMTIGAFFPLFINLFIHSNYISSLITINITLTGLIILFDICRPFKKYTTIVFSIGVSLSTLLMFAFNDVFLDPNYLKGISGGLNQIKLIFDDFFKMQVFKSFSYHEVISIIISSILLILIYILALFIKKKNLINKFLLFIKKK